MSVFEWFSQALTDLGWYRKQMKVFFIGIDNAGKTSLLHMLKEGRMAVHEPTMTPHQDEIIFGNFRFLTFDLGGHETSRRIWPHYFALGVDGIVFMLDASDPQRFPEAKREIEALLASALLSNVPMLILGNKMDSDRAVSEDELRCELGLSNTFGKQSHVENMPTSMRPVELYKCSVVNKEGYHDGITWLTQFF